MNGRRRNTGPSECGSLTKLWRTLTTLLQHDNRTTDDSTPTSNYSDTFVLYFDVKVRTVLAATDGRQPPAFSSTGPGVSLSELSPCTDDEVRRLISQSATKSCALNPILTFLLKELIDVLLPYMTEMINASLCDGQLPLSQNTPSSLHC